MKKFSPEQQRVIDHASGKLLVSASGGSGKTDILAQRLADFLEKEKSDEYICVTFSRSAADEMRTRVADILKEKSRDIGEINLNIGTLHSFCKRLLEDFWHEHYGDDVGERYPIITEDVENDLIRQACIKAMSEEGKGRRGSKRKFIRSKFKDHPLYLLCTKNKNDRKELEKEYYKAVRKQYKSLFLSRYVDSEDGVNAMTLLEKNTHQPIEFTDVEYNGPDYVRKVDRKLITAAAQELLNIKLSIDDRDGSLYYRSSFDDLLLTTLSLIRHDKLKPKYDWVQVDEIQDLSDLHLEIIDGLTKKDATVVYFGDANQSIYSMQGASPKIVLNLKDELGAERVIHLNTNWRSTPKLIQYQRHFIDAFLRGKNDPKSRLESGLRSGRGDEPVEWRKFEDHRKQMAGVISIAKNLRKEMLKEIDKNEDIAKDEPYVAILFRTRYECKQYEAAFRKNNESPFVFSDSTFIDFKEIQEIVAAFEEKNRDRMVADARVIMEGTDVIKGLEDIAGKSEYAKNNHVRLFIEYARHLRDKYSNECKQTGRPFDPNFLFNEIKNSSVEDTWGIKDDDGHRIIPPGILISTVHKAKGKEFRTVIVPSVVEGIYPYEASKTREEREEDARVFYVAISRAKKKLILTSYGKGPVSVLTKKKFVATGDRAKHKKAKSVIRTFRGKRYLENLRPSPFIVYQRGLKII